MAERRMISKRIIETARFLKMPISSQCLYFYLCINADDDGVVEAFPVMRGIGCSEDDLRVLAAKQFIYILNDDLVSYITDWLEHNKIRADRKIDSLYKDLLVEIIPEAKVLEPRPRADRPYSTRTAELLSVGRPWDDPGTTPGQPRDRIGKDRIGKDRLDISSNELFEKFWSEYPKKQGKKKALASWQKIKPDEELFKTIMDSLQKFKATDQWKKDNGQYIPMPSTWLNNNRWEDEFEAPIVSNQPRLSDREQEIKRQNDASEALRLALLGR